MASRISALERTRTIPTGTGAPTTTPGDGAQYVDKTSGNYYIRENATWISYPRIIRGTVTSAGAVGIGAGFSAVRNGAGDFTVTFTTAFASTPSVSISAGATAAFYVVKLSATTPPSAGGFRVTAFNPNTFAAVDGEFTFTAEAV